ncbi:MAG: hypothetical protein WBK55_00040 [Alphaproteobacteria bacterium]
MKLANIFPSQALMAPVLTAALSLASIFSPSTGQAQEPKITTVSTTTQDRNASIPAPSMSEEEAKNSEFWKAAQYSKNGVAILVFLAEGDTIKKNSNNLASLMRLLAQEKIAAKIFPIYTAQSKTYAVITVGGISYNGQKDGVDYGQGYSLNQLGTLLAEARTAYKEAFPQRISSAAQTEELTAKIP